MEEPTLGPHLLATLLAVYLVQRLALRESHPRQPSTIAWDAARPGCLSKVDFDWYMAQRNVVVEVRAGKKGPIVQGPINILRAMQEPLIPRLGLTP